MFWHSWRMEMTSGEPVMVRHLPDGLDLMHDHCSFPMPLPSLAGAGRSKSGIRPRQVERRVSAAQHSPIPGSRAAVSLWPVAVDPAIFVGHTEPRVEQLKPILDDAITRRRAVLEK